ncbi:hypothetical protein HZH68_011214 [Vespula germanica]|uniref:Abscisic acid G-protein coupled receptor-like domain-containing protein n=1 Tax=Vespula germanica TaxID=30212 RepID=A0A834JNC1_VESGE|nr:hypothetical protein HZH68_011214 [Vespula germanica]
MSLEALKTSSSGPPEKHDTNSFEKAALKPLAIYRNSSANGSWSQSCRIGCIVLTSIRGLLLTLTKFFYAISSSKSSNIIVLILAQIMGMYFVSSVLLMRMNMPAEYRIIITQVLGELQFNFYHRWFDVIFLVSALSSIVFLYLAHKQAPTERT